MAEVEDARDVRRLDLRGDAGLLENISTNSASAARCGWMT